MTKEEIERVQDTLHEIAVKLDFMNDWMHQQGLVEDIYADLRKLTGNEFFLKKNVYIAAERYLRLNGANPTDASLELYEKSVCEYCAKNGYPVAEYMDGNKPVKLFRYEALEQFVMF